MRKHSCAAIIIQNYKILSVKRRKKPFKDSWICPGGKGRSRESPLETVAVVSSSRVRYGRMGERKRKGDLFHGMNSWF